MTGRSKVAIIGASGYSGAEIVTLLLRHPAVEVATLMTANQERQGANRSQKLSEVLPQFLQLCDLEIESLDFDELQRRKVAIVFLATPNETSHALVPQLLQRNLKVIDLSGAYRLKEKALYPHWYGFEHQFPSLLESAVYGLTEVNHERIRSAQLLANRMLPYFRPAAADPSATARTDQYQVDIVCDSKSGVSGAGKSPSPNTHFSEVTESFKAYNVMSHRHTPEIWQELDSPNLIFTPHLLPINRGILSTIYLKTQKTVTESVILDCLQEAYGSEPFVRIHRHGALPEIKFVAHTNFCDIGWRFDVARSNLILISSLICMWEGRRTQAVRHECDAGDR
jgi:N-acetyl-gamma-glutamyl-phosphate reductase